MSHPTQHDKHRAGFTLVEILIVVVILGILAVIAIPRFSGAAGKAGSVAVRSQLVTMRGQIEVWRVRNGRAIPGGMSGDIADVWQALIDNDQIHMQPVLSPGFEWRWDGATAQLGVVFDSDLNPVIPDVDADGDGDQDDVNAIGRW